MKIKSASYIGEKSHTVRIQKIAPRSGVTGKQKRTRGRNCKVKQMIRHIVC